MRPGWCSRTSPSSRDIPTRIPDSSRRGLGVAADCAPAPITAGLDVPVSSHTMAPGPHFFPDDDPENLGHKALAVNLSDMAAMGALPYWAMLALTVPHVDHAWLAAFSKG